MSKTKKARTTESITHDTIRAAYATLEKYKAGKASLEQRIIDNEQWWKLRHYDEKNKDSIATGWLFNTIINKHADAMDNVPEATCLPREKSDRPAARLLTEVLPLILEQNHFEDTYSECWYDKLKYGAACYGVFWNPALDSGMGNTDVRRVDLLNLFWEPGITNIQQSKNIFLVDLWDWDDLLETYPVLEDCLSAPTFDVTQYIYDDAVDTSDKSAVIDWYYKTIKNGKQLVHFCKFCNGVLLYASENDPLYKDSGFYNHGKYPFVIDKMYPIQGSPCGFSVIDAMRGAQKEIDILSSAIVRNARMASERRFFVRSDGSINEKEFAQWDQPFVHYSGSGDPSSSIMPITVPALSEVYVAILNNKIDEIKETTGNRDFSQGSTAGGVTAASAIAALQEAGNKGSRDMLSGAYRAYEEICSILIELIRQFYTLPRWFRIIAPNGQEDFVQCSSQSFTANTDKNFLKGAEPIFDIKVRAHKRTAFSRMEMNELACELYKMGIFEPGRSREAQLCLEMMEFEGKDEILRRVQENINMEQNSMLSAPEGLIQ